MERMPAEELLRQIRRPARTPVHEWTDDEWLAVMAKFPPNIHSRLAEQWVLTAKTERWPGSAPNIRRTWRPRNGIRLAYKVKQRAGWRCECVRGGCTTRTSAAATPKAPCRPTI